MAKKESAVASKSTEKRCYVKIAKEGAEHDIAEVPTNADRKLPQQTVKALFDGTSAIKYKPSAVTSTWRALLLEEDLYHPPEGEWGERVYICTQPIASLPKESGNVGFSGFPGSSASAGLGCTRFTSPGSLLQPAAPELSSFYSPAGSPYHLGLGVTSHIWGSTAAAGGQAQAQTR